MTDVATPACRQAGSMLDSVSFIIFFYSGLRPFNIKGRSCGALGNLLKYAVYQKPAPPGLQAGYYGHGLAQNLRRQHIFHKSRREKLLVAKKKMPRNAGGMNL